MPQSISSRSTMSLRRANCGCRRGCTVKPSGIVNCDSTTRFTTSIEIPVGTVIAGACGCSLTSPSRMIFEVIVDR